MSSFISHFRPWLVALLVLLGIEMTYFAVSRPPRLERTNFLQFAFATSETPQRLFVYHKLEYFSDSRPKIVIAGDSSGFYGIQPTVVTQHLPSDTKMVNLSCCANLGFRGYYNILEYMIEHNSSVRYVVLYFTAYTMPSSPLWDGDGAQLWADTSLKVFGGDVWREFLSPWRIFQVPSLAARRWVTDDIYYLGHRFKQRDAPLLDNANYLEFLSMFRETGGWMPERDQRVAVSAAACPIQVVDFFDWRVFSRRTYLQDVLETYADMARRHGVVLVVAFQPTACSGGPGAERANAIIQTFKKANPDVEIPFEVAETWPADRFSVPAHVKNEFSGAVSDRLGNALAEIIRRRSPRQP
jgi:hypothetical protein